jgi:hypothetical protein
MLNDTEMAYGEFKYAIQKNFAGNGLSMYSARNAPFQIDANFGYVEICPYLFLMNLRRQSPWELLGNEAIPRRKVDVLKK